MCVASCVPRSPGMRLRIFSSKVDYIAANFDEVRLISNVCPGNHYHEAWGVVAKGANKRVFATSLEVHYPPLLCDAIVQAFLACFVKLGCVEVSRVLQNPAAQLLTGKQPRSSKVLPACST